MNKGAVLQMRGTAPLFRHKKQKISKMHKKCFYL